MGQQVGDMEEVVLTEEKDHVRLITLNKPQQLNLISSKVVDILAESLEKWEKDDNVELIIIKGKGRAFSAGGDLKMFFTEGKTDASCTEVVYRMYWLLHHIHTYKKTMVALVHSLAMGGGASLSVPLKFSVVTGETVLRIPEITVGFHSDCSFSYILSHLPGHLGEYLALTGAPLNGKEMISVGLATHFILSENLPELEKRLVSLKSCDDTAVKSLIEEFSVTVQPDENSILNKQAVIDKCFSKETVEDIIDSLEQESCSEENRWLADIAKSLKRSSPTALKIIFRSIREGRKQSLCECLKKEFRLTMNMLKSVISEDLYEGIRAFLAKDKGPKWKPSKLDEVSEEKLDLIFQPFEEERELKIPDEQNLSRWCGKFEDSAYKNEKH